MFPRVVHPVQPETVPATRQSIEITFFPVPRLEKELKSRSKLPTAKPQTGRLGTRKVGVDSVGAFAKKYSNAGLARAAGLFL